MKKILIALAVAVCSLALSLEVRAEKDKNTLEKIANSKEINIGYRTTSIPLSFAVGDGPPQGYSIDISQQVVAKVGKTLNLPDLKVNYHKITPQDRIEMVQNGTIDFECSVTTITPERLAQVGFSRPFYVTSLTFLYNEDKSGVIDTSMDLKGRTVALVKGTTGEFFLQKRNLDLGLNLNFVVVHDNNEALEMLEQGKVTAIFQDDVQLAGLRARSAMASKLVMVAKPEHSEPFGCVYRHGDDQFGAIINSALADFAKSDGLTVSYRKWFVYPIDSLGGIELKMPMSKGTREARDALKGGS